MFSSPGEGGRSGFDLLRDNELKGIDGTWWSRSGILRGGRREKIFLNPQELACRISTFRRVRAGREAALSGVRRRVRVALTPSDSTWAECVRGRLTLPLPTLCFPAVITVPQLAGGILRGVIL